MIIKLQDGYGTVVESTHVRAVRYTNRGLELLVGEAKIEANYPDYSDIGIDDIIGRVDWAKCKEDMERIVEGMSAVEKAAEKLMSYFKRDQ